MRRLSFVVVTLFVLLLPSLETTAAEGAQVNSGVIDQHECTDNGTTTVCLDLQGRSQGTLTPSGNYSTLAIFPVNCLTETDNATGNVIYSDCQPFQHMFLYKQGETHVEHTRVFHVRTEGDITYCTLFRIQVANGEIRYLTTTEGTGDEC